LAQIMGDFNHDSVNRFLLREQFDPQDLFKELQPFVNWKGGILSVDDTVLDKPYSDPDKAELIGYFWSGKHHKSVQGINLITLNYSEPEDHTVPINFRIYDKREGKTKNDYFRDMVEEVISWGIEPIMVTGDSWYSSVENLKFLKNKELGFLFGIEKNRIVSSQPSEYQQVQHLEIPNDGVMTHLRELGFVRVFRESFADKEPRHYILYLPEPEELNKAGFKEFEEIHKKHWGIEMFHRAAKQVCNIENFRVRSTQAIKTHIFCAMRAFICLELRRADQLVKNWYELQRQLFVEVIRKYILENLGNVFKSTTPHYASFVNA